MKHKRVRYLYIALTSLCLMAPAARAQTDADPIFTKKQVFRSLSDRWELD